MKKLFLALCFVSALQANAVTRSSGNASLAPAMSYSLSPGLNFIGNWFGPSFTSYVGIAPISGHEFYIGGELGVGIYLPGFFAMNFDILPTAWYQFKIPQNQNLRIVAGMSFGPTVFIGGTGVGGFSGVTYELLLRPGFLLKTSESMIIGGDLRFGTIGGAFVFKPVFNMIFPL